MSLKCASSEYDIVVTLLKRYIKHGEVWAFGSRVHGQNLKPFSDLDLVIKTNKALSNKLRFELQEAFSQSDLPFRVDIVEWAGLSDEFKAIISRNCERVI